MGVCGCVRVCVVYMSGGGVGGEHECMCRGLCQL